MTAVQETPQENCLLPLDTMNKVMHLIGSLPYQQVSELVDELKENVRVISPTPEQDAVAPSEPEAGDAD